MVPNKSWPKNAQTARFLAEFLSAVVVEEEGFDSTEILGFTLVLDIWMMMNTETVIRLSRWRK